MLQIIDYGMGNLRSVQKAFEHVGVDAEICSDPAVLHESTALVLPGVGAFQDAIAELNRLGFSDLVREHVAAGKPLLGICLGLQLLFDVSEEDGEHKGLGIVPGRVVRFESQPGLKIPHMGWNAVHKAKDVPETSTLNNGDYVYFVHSYYVKPEDPSVVALSSNHSHEFCAAIQTGSVFATQFHPEKSQDVGLAMLKNFANSIAASV